MVFLMSLKSDGLCVTNKDEGQEVSVAGYLLKKISLQKSKTSQACITSLRFRVSYSGRVFVCEGSSEI